MRTAFVMALLVTSCHGKLAHGQQTVTIQIAAFEPAVDTALHPLLCRGTHLCLGHLAVAIGVQPFETLRHLLCNAGLGGLYHLVPAQHAVAIRIDPLEPAVDARRPLRHPMAAHFAAGKVPVAIGIHLLEQRGPRGRHLFKRYFAILVGIDTLKCRFLVAGPHRNGTRNKRHRNAGEHYSHSIHLHSLFPDSSPIVSNIQNAAPVLFRRVAEHRSDKKSIRRFCDIQTRDMLHGSPEPASS